VQSPLLRSLTNDTFPIQKNPSVAGPVLMDDKSEPFPCGRGFLLISLKMKDQFLPFQDGGLNL